MSYTEGLLKKRLYYTHVVQSPDYSFMDSSSLPRHQLIESLIAQHAEDVVDSAVRLWEEMAVEIVSIISEGGFNSLYARSVFLSQPSIPLLSASALPLQAIPRFAELKKSFEGLSSSEVSAANNLLLRVFTDILATLIGEDLTSNILRSAWGNHASEKTGKESDNE